MKFNAALAKALGDTKFEWGSLQININSVSKEHRDANNTGLSAIVLFGEFSGGKFAMSDESHSLESHDVGTALIIDGTKLHYSEPFNGYRVSVVAFLHNATMDLPASQLGYLRWLGFNVPEARACSDISHGAERLYEVAHCNSCMAYWSDSGALRLPGWVYGMSTAQRQKLVPGVPEGLSQVRHACMLMDTLAMREPCR